MAKKTKEFRDFTLYYNGVFRIEESNGDDYMVFLRIQDLLYIMEKEGVDIRKLDQEQLALPVTKSVLTYESEMEDGDEFFDTAAYADILEDFGLTIIDVHVKK